MPEECSVTAIIAKKWLSSMLRLLRLVAYKLDRQAINRWMKDSWMTNRWTIGR